MSDDTYYTVLDVSETATQLEIKAAYRNLIKQIHPDKVATLSPDLRRMAEGATEDLIEAYSALSDAVQRREYDRQLAEYRQQSAPAPTGPSNRSSKPASTAGQNTRPRQPQARYYRYNRVRFKHFRFGFAIVCIVSYVLLFGRSIYDKYQTRDATAPETDQARPVSSKSTAVFKRPYLSHLTTAEQQSIQAACPQSRFETSAVYDQCLFRQLKEWESGPKQPDLSRLTSDEEASIQGACTHAQYDEGLAAYKLCLVRELEAWERGPKQPDLSRLTGDEHSSIQAACFDAKLKGPAAYDRCLIRELKDRAHP
jgi:hypothetical protein